MNTRTGELKDELSLEDRLDEYVAVKKEDMTKKQAEEKQVSLSDRRSKLGIMLTELRAKQGNKLDNGQKKLERRLAFGR